MTKIIVVGGLNTDIIASGVDMLLNEGELTRSGELIIGPGGKSRNIAQMIAAYEPSLDVHMIGKTARDSHHLWEVPYKALVDAGVNVDAVEILPESAGLAPGVALIAVDREGQNQIYCLPGVNDTLCTDDIAKTESLFEQTATAGGVLAMTLEMPIAAAISAVQMAGRKGVKTIVDPGGIGADDDWRAIMDNDVFLLKPNEHEMAMLTGRTVTDLASAEAAARALMTEFPIANVLVTHGSLGAYLVDADRTLHLPVTEVANTVGCDTTGCGDQTTAVMAAEIARGTPLADAAQKAILAGSLQYYRVGIQPVNSKDLEVV